MKPSGGKSYYAARRFARLEWGAKMAKRRENARLARALEMDSEIRRDTLVGQFLVLGFGGPPRLIRFEAKGKGLVAICEKTGATRRVSTKHIWAVAAISLHNPQTFQSSSPGCRIVTP